MQPQSRKLLEDMRDAAADVAAFAAGKALQNYVADKQLRWSIERGFEIIGEALSQIRKFDPELVERISQYRKIISFRNILIHNYGKVDPEITWDIVQNDLPLLRRQLDDLLRE
jgi:uncharacterized protein with HEPN domain